MPEPGHASPIGCTWCFSTGQSTECGGDVCQRDTHTLRDFDNGYSAQNLTFIATLVAVVTLTGDKPLAFVKMQCGHGHTAASGHFAYRQQFSMFFGFDLWHRYSRTSTLVQ